MNVEQSSHGDPFRCYVGTRVRVEGDPHVVECYEVLGRNLLFRLRGVESGREKRLSMLELLALMEQQAR